MPKKNTSKGYDMLGAWPAFPIAIWDFIGFTPEEDKIIAALDFVYTVVFFPSNTIVQVKSSSSVSQDRNQKNLCLLCAESHSRHRQILQIDSHWRDERAALVVFS